MSQKNSNLAEKEKTQKRDGTGNIILMPSFAETCDKISVEIFIQHAAFRKETFSFSSFWKRNGELISLVHIQHMHRNAQIRYLFGFINLEMFQS